MISFTSCEVEVDDFFDDDDIGEMYYSRSRDLCSRTWEDTYVNVDGHHCFQALDFYIDRTGVDYQEVRYPDGSVETMEHRFRWNWDNFQQTVIRMEYGPRDVSYLEEVRIGGNRLSGYLDSFDNYVEYVGRR
ncbi:hypothetical protein EVA_15857 [gut metagenome]|uniref:Uncharacterized protein n=1 Tax=gut metagenome TaxID=749906 RepID=J9G2M8_9ZZZZ